MASVRPKGVTAVVAVAVDAALVLLFVVLGRLSHEEGLAAGGVLSTWWPFLVGLAIGWLACAGWRRPRAILWTGVAAWAGSVLIGMIVRLLVGQGAEAAFVLVAAAVLGIFLVGWRALALLARRVRRTDRSVTR